MIKLSILEGDKLKVKSKYYKSEQNDETFFRPHYSEKLKEDPSRSLEDS